MSKRQFSYQHEPLIIPANWRDEGRRFAVQTEHLFDDVYQKIGRVAEQKVSFAQSSGVTDIGARREVCGAADVLLSGVAAGGTVVTDEIAFAGVFDAPPRIFLQRVYSAGADAHFVFDVYSATETGFRIVATNIGATTASAAPTNQSTLQFFAIGVKP